MCLLGIVVKADIIVTFRRLLDRYMDMQGVEGYGYLRRQIRVGVSNRHCGLCCIVLLYVWSFLA